MREIGKGNIRSYTHLPPLEIATGSLFSSRLERVVVTESCFTFRLNRASTGLCHERVEIDADVTVSEWTARRPLVIRCKRKESHLECRSRPRRSFVSIGLNIEV